LGAVYQESGSYPDTVSALTGALQAARAVGDMNQEANILSNLGLAHQYAGHYSAAVPCYERAVELADESVDAVMRTCGLGQLGAGVFAPARLSRRHGAAERAIEGCSIL
jgi:tetratricopeptide (TPR) repeat protein